MNNDKEIPDISFLQNFVVIFNAKHCVMLGKNITQLVIYQVQIPEVPFFVQSLVRLLSEKLGKNFRE
jgi:hypothetical protein